MLVTDATSSGAIPALEAALKFAAQRQPIIAGNIANIDTPNHLQADVSPAAFQAQLRRAIEARRERSAGQSGALELGRSAEVRQDAHGDLILSPMTPSGNILFHDRNNRDLERLMQDQTENLSVFRVSAELLRSRFEIIRTAAADRV